MRWRCCQTQQRGAEEVVVLWRNETIEERERKTKRERKRVNSRNIREEMLCRRYTCSLQITYRLTSRQHLRNFLRKSSVVVLRRPHNDEENVINTILQRRLNQPQIRKLLKRRYLGNNKRAKE